MASTEIDEPKAGSTGTSYTKRFVAAPTSAPEASTSPERPASEGSRRSTRTPEQARTRTIAAAVGMGVAALLCFVLAAGFSGGETPVSDDVLQQATSLRDRMHEAEMKAESLPDADHAERGLSTALESADQVADLQNGYRSLTPEVAAGGGSLAGTSADSTLQNLTPYFATSVDRSELGPWYLLAGDKDVPEGNGLPMSFDSGFEWKAQVPYTVEDDGTVEVTWLAVETRTGQGDSPAVLAWARADYDITRKAFSTIETGTTATGEALRLEVAAP